MKSSAISPDSVSIKDHIWYLVVPQVHAAFAGYTNITVGVVNTHYCFLPIPVVIKKPRMVDPNSNMYHRCVTATGQPDFNPPTFLPFSGSSHGASSRGSRASLQPHPPPARGSIRKGRHTS